MALGLGGSSKGEAGSPGDPPRLQCTTIEPFIPSAAWIVQR